ncbi:thioredoxin-disulfide reductase [Clostridium botulinum]|uniref:Thioredoxin reductase n=1 Tax=Clostridium botulinum (strain Hall / ATCC 3502 / NCTC 13319 / Type A) TaxID=441771 RepID=A5I194_CLOBH|nr:thioredoxin-disulfide reductase [Clostridium botulinum]ABS35353.1 putative thioredoxin reductase [Clostridium botulinum A str. ATCC 19397]ABS37865.1 putative thioredoxin reductase [Clostridium botulinum A str. Hall]APQ74700.1 thioredoxin-disulfide reductase [Clostridium botulinum]AUM87391.1 thioredoxin-disulfide reductase [Clostridium botulinum]AWB17169.1 thioredoxin-disulfide reductase [Clostridium botulinum]
MNKKNKNLDLMIIGAGPAGLSAAIYAARAKLNMILIENGIIGGQVRSSYTVENYPGFKKIEGNRLADLMQEQATDLGATIDEFDMVEKIQLNNNEKIVETSEYIYKPTVLIISTGATARKLPIPSEGKFSGKGIHYCAICDGAMYEGKTVGVIGGGNAALEEALFLTKFASKVYMIRRYDYFKGEKATLEEVENNSKIEILYNWDLVDVYGSNFIDKALIKNVKTKEEKELKLDGVFGFIGSEPKTELFKEYISLTPKGYIKTNENMETNIKGVYAAGDVREKQFRQITTAVADGTIAALAAEKYIMEKTREK